MPYKHQLFQRLLMLFVLFTITFVFGFAQDKKAAEEVIVETDAAPILSVSGIGNGNSDEEDDTKITGATVRGRVFYEDTGRPVRYALVTLVGEKSDSFSNYSLKYVKTDENGEFLLKNVKAGTYLPYIKSEGILNQDSYSFSYRRAPGEKKPADLFEKITVSGLDEFQINIAAKRGGAISGRISYADGESAVGVKVEVLKKTGDTFSNASSSYSSESSIGSVKTDDRGFYRIAGLPEGIYIVRVVEPVSHNVAKAEYIYSYRENQGSLLKTYFPEGENASKAKEIELLPGQEQPSIDITLPERQLFGVSGRVVQKGNKQPLDKMTVNFFKMPDAEQQLPLADFSYTGSITISNKAGEWALKSLPKGKYRITVSQAIINYNSEREAKDKPQQFPPVTKEIEVTDKNISDLIFEMPTESSIRGTIVAEGGKNLPPDIRLFAVSMETGEMSYSENNYYPTEKEKTQRESKEKDFRVGKIKEGKYKIILGDKNYYVKSVSGSAVSGDSLIEVKEGEETSGIQIVIASDFGTVKGKIDNFQAGEQAIVVMVKSGLSIEQAQAGAFSGAVESGGEYKVKAAPGEYSIFVFMRKMRPKAGTTPKEMMRNMLKDAQKVTVRANEETSLNLKMPE